MTKAATPIKTAAAAATPPAQEHDTTPPSGDGGSTTIPGYNCHPWPGPFMVAAGMYFRQTDPAPNAAGNIPAGIYLLSEVSLAMWSLINALTGQPVDDPMLATPGALDRAQFAQLVRGEQYLPKWEALRSSPIHD